MMGNEKLKKLPVIRYLCYLLVVSILFTGVTFSRYTGTTSGNIDTSLSRFVCSYTIGDMSSTSFTNADYWLNEGSGVAMNTARTVRFTIQNYISENGTERVSDVDLQSTLRLYAPAEFAGNLAIQVARVTDGGTYAVTPQYVLKDIIYGGDGEFRTSGVVKTADSDDYNDRTDCDDEELTITSSFSGTQDEHAGTLTAYCANTGNQLTITAAKEEAEYSVGFSRHDAEYESQFAPSLYLDLVKEVTFYTVDISLPSMLLEGNKAESRTYVLYLTILSSYKDNADFDAVWGENNDEYDYSNDYNDLLKAPTSKEDEKTFNGATVTGYHFERTAQLYAKDEDGNWVSTGSDTTIRIKKEYDYENGGATLSYYHVAPLSQNGASVAHQITNFYDENGTTATVSDIASVQGLYGECLECEESGYIYFAGITDDPFYSSYENQDAGGTHDYAIGEALSKGYSTKLNVLFIQASES